MMSKILKVKNKEALKGAIDLGIAMQLTNIATRCYAKIKNVTVNILSQTFLSIKETIKESRHFLPKIF